MSLYQTAVKFSIRLPSDLNQALEKICVTRRGVTKTQIIQAALNEYLFPEGTDKRDAEIARHLRRLERRVKNIERGNEILGETISLYIRAWLTNTAEVPETHKEAAISQGGRRYRNFLDGLSVRLQSGKCLFADLPEDVFEVAKPQEFFNEEALERELEATA
jgi:predicted transcriptional regulator